MTVLDLRSPTVDIFDEPGDTFAVVLTLLDDDGQPFDASAYTLEATVTADVETPPTFDIAVSGAGDNIVTMTMDDATETLSGDYTLTATLGDSTSTWLSGSLVLIPGGRGSGNGIQEVTVNIGTTILATVVLGAAQGGGGGGAPSGPAGGVLSGTYPDPGFAADMATQAELDAVSTVANTAIAPGDTAGGVLSGTYPNPGFAADMATQAELDAVSTVANTAIAPGDTAGGVLSGTYPNPGFAADMATQAELDAVSTVADAAIAPGDTAGGVLSGTYPNPGFAADMATQAELDAAVALRALATPTVAALTPTTGTVDLDLATVHAQYLTHALSGNVTYTSSNRAAGKFVTIRVTAASTRTLAFPAWVFVGTEPTEIAAGKTGILTVTWFGSADTDAVAAWAVEA